MIRIHQSKRRMQCETVCTILQHNQALKDLVTKSRPQMYPWPVVVSAPLQIVRGPVQGMSNTMHENS